MFNLKKEFLSTAINNYERVYVHVMPHVGLSIGERGLVGNEAEVGIVLSIGGQTAQGLSLDDDKLLVQLRFAGKWEFLQVPYEAIDAILNDLVSPEFIINFPMVVTNSVPNTTDKPSAKVLKLDFNRKK